eukprot:7416056-Pyramimonas_sp.AAC.1
MPRRAPPHPGSPAHLAARRAVGGRPAQAALSSDWHRRGERRSRASHREGHAAQGRNDPQG